MTRFLPVSLVLFGCQFQASCGGSSLKMDAAKELVAGALESDVGVKPTSVTCPESVKAEAGATFECVADFGGPKATVVIKQKDDQGNVTVESVTGILVARKLEAAVAKGIGEQLNIHAAVDCGPRVRQGVVGEKFNCQASDAKGASATIEVLVKDDRGNVSWRIVENP